jgi:hypothetical protein
MMRALSIKPEDTINVGVNRRGGSGKVRSYSDQEGVGVGVRAS